MSKSYLGRYFRKHTGLTLRDYVQSYKLRLVEEWLKNTDRQIGEIAQEFGFTDSSHLNRLFKKSTGVAPIEFRRSFRQISSSHRSGASSQAAGEASSL